MEYNEVYGWMPQEVINHLSEIDRQKMFLNWVLRKPTATGWFIVRVIFATMGDDFTIHLINGITECLEKEGEKVTKENVVEVLSTMMESFATDPNILVEVVREYRTSVLHLDDDVLETDDPKGIIPGNKKTPERDAKGRFVKKYDHK